MWYTGVPRHATGKDFVKGDPGSPYSISDWYDVNPYLAADGRRRMKAFEALVQRTHDAGMRVCTDFIPNHVSRDYRGSLPHFDYCDYDWTDTLKVDWSRPETEEEMTRILLFWAGKGVDAFRCDMVELVPADALGRVISAVRARYPGIGFIAEVYGRENYGRYLSAGFDLLYDKSGVYDILRGICCGTRSARELTWNWQFLGDKQSGMVNFLENHDEQRICSPWFCGSADRAWAAVAFAMLYNDASWLMYFGQEVGEDASEGFEGRTSIFEWCRPAGVERLAGYASGMRRPSGKDAAVLGRYRELLTLAGKSVFRSGSVWDLCYCQTAESGFDADRHFAFLRYSGRTAYLVFCNFADSAAEVDILFPAELSDVLRSGGMKVRAGAHDYAAVRL